jgi:hypothetical protein
MQPHGAETILPLKVPLRTKRPSPATGRGPLTWSGANRARTADLLRACESSPRAGTPQRNRQQHLVLAMPAHLHEHGHETLLLAVCAQHEQRSGVATPPPEPMVMRSGRAPEPAPDPGVGLSAVELTGPGGGRLHRGSTCSALMAPSAGSAVQAGYAPTSGGPVEPRSRRRGGWTVRRR